MKIFYTIFIICYAIFFNSFCNADDEDDELMNLEEVESLRFITDSDGKIQSIKAIKFKSSLDLRNEISVSNLESISSWEEDKIKELIPDAPKLMEDFKVQKITYSSNLDFWRKSNKYLISFNASISSFYYNNIDKVIFDKYGILLLRRISKKKHRRKFSVYLGSEFSYISNFYHVGESDIIFLKSQQARIFKVINYRMGNFFLKFEGGINLLEYSNDVNFDVFLKFPIEKGLNGFVQINVVFEDTFLKEKKNFHSYGFVKSKIGLISDINKNLSAEMFLSYEKNKRYGFKSQEMGFAIKYKRENPKMPKLFH